MDKIDKLLEAVEHPERFSESELQSLLSDSETKQLYLLLCASRADAFIQGDIPDDAEIERKWHALRMQKNKRILFSRLFNRKIAVAAAFLIASCSIIMVGVSLSKRAPHGADIEEKVQIAASAADESAEQSVVAVNDTVIIFEDEKLDKILMEIAPYYNVRVDLKSPDTKEVRLFLKWDSTTEVGDLVDQLNSFDRINLFLKEDAITDY